MVGARAIMALLLGRASPYPDPGRYWAEAGAYLIASYLGCGARRE